MQNQDSKTLPFKIVMSSTVDENTEVVTAANIDDYWRQRAMSEYDPANKKYSTYLKETSSSSLELTDDNIDNWTTSPQTDLKKVLNINQVIRQLVNKNDLVGKVVECINSNILANLKHTYSHVPEGRNKQKQFDNVRAFIHNFEDQIQIKQLIRRSITTAYMEGNCVMYLRSDDVENYIIDFYPLGLVEVSDYEVNGQPVVLMNINELKSRLQKTYKKNKKGKALFFDKIEDEVKANYGKEVVDGFKAGDSYVILDTLYTGMIRINNNNRQYGVSPILRTFNDLAMLDSFANADKINSKAKSKKILFQKMRKEAAMDASGAYNKKYFEELAYSHGNLCNAWSQPTVLYTGTPFVESVSYVEPKTELTSTDTINTYRSKVLSTLGISFLMDTSNQTASTASISVDQLLRVINSISEQLEDILEKFIRQALYDNNMPTEYAPDIEVIDSEILNYELRKELATTLYTLFNGSLTTSLGILGFDIEDEKMKREKENNDGIDQIFAPRATSYTSSGRNTSDGGPDSNYTNNTGGRPQSNENQDKQEYDKARNKEIKDSTGGGA